MIVIVVIALIIFIYFALRYDLLAKKVICTSSTDVSEPGDPIKTKITAVFKKGKVKYINVKYTYLSKSDAKANCSNYKDDKKRTSCFRKSVTVYKTDDFSSVEGNDLLGLNSNSYKKIMKSNNYVCK